MYVKGNMYKLYRSFFCIYINKDSIHMHNIDASILINQ